MSTPSAVAAEPLDEIARRAEELERQGAWEASGREFSRLFARGVEERRVEAMADALRGGARVRNRQDRSEEAEELAVLSWHVAERNGLDRAAARAINLAAYIRHSQADLGSAGALYEVALGRARAARDDELVGLVCQNLGVIANIQGNLDEARLMYLESIAASVRSGDETTAMMAYNNLGMVCSDQREWIEARLYFDRGLDIAERTGNAPLLARLFVNRAEPLIHLGELSRARTSLERAEEVALAIGDREVQVDVLRFRAIVARLHGDYDGADRCLETALALATEARLDLNRAEVLGGIGRLRQAQGRAEEACAALREARVAFQALGASREVARLDASLQEDGLAEAFPDFG